MGPHLLKACKVFAVAIGAFVFASTASAGTVDLHFTSAPGDSVSVKVVSGTGAGTYNGITAGPYSWTASAGSGFLNPTITFCTQLNGVIHGGSGNSNAFNVYVLPTTVPGLSSTQQTAITNLYAADYKTALTSYDNGASFQLALWAIVYEGNGPYAVGNGTGNTDNFQATSAPAGVIANANTWLSNLGNASQPSLPSGSQIDWLASTDWGQNQVTMLPPPTGPNTGVPAPPGIVLAGLGFVGLIGRSRLFRRVTAAA